MEKETKVTVPSYTHEGSVSPYCLEPLGEDFEISVRPENIIMGVCALHKAEELENEGIQTTIITLGGAANANKRILERLNDIKDTEIPIISSSESNSIASNISSLSNFDGPFVIFCQDFTKTRISIHSEYYLKEKDYKITDWESYIENTKFSDFEADLLEELISMSDIPYIRKLIEKALLVPLARLDPKNGGVKGLSSIRERVREEEPEENFFTKSGLD